METIVLVGILILVGVFALTGLIALYIYFRKKIWYSLVGAILAILIGIIVPVVTGSLVLWENIPDDNILRAVTTGFETGIITLVLRFVFRLGYKVSDYTFQSQK